MAYVVVRIFSSSGMKKSADENSETVHRELRPKLTAAGGLIRFVTIAFSDGRYGSFSAYESQDAARRGHQVAVEWVKNHPDAEGVSLSETMEGDVVYAAEGTANMTGGLHGVSRIYRTNASVSDIKSAFESEGPAAISAFVGLARYSVVKLNDGRVGTFGSFDTPENARNSSEEARRVRAKAGSQIGRCLPSDPQVLEGTIIGVYQN